MSIRSNIESIRRQVADAQAQADRPSDKIELLAVSKTHPAAMIREAYHAGQRSFGENYADELEAKQIELAHLPGIRFVFIGQLQSNKIQKIVRHADEIQSVASEKHARYIERYAAELGKNLYPIWIVVNAEEEKTKQGVSFEALADLAAYIESNCPHLSLQGVMAIPPSTYSDEAWIHSGSTEVPELYQKLRQAARMTGQGKLSLGMTSDLRLAIAAGSNCIRIGTAIFGARH